jgi:methylmalonyl-CoA mutase cobalamin-binding subunit
MRTRAEYVVALGRVGGDAHSVGLIILDRFLRRAGFDSATSACRTRRLRVSRGDLEPCRLGY